MKVPQKYFRSMKRKGGMFPLYYTVIKSDTALFMVWRFLITLFALSKFSYPFTLINDYLFLYPNDTNAMVAKLLNNIQRYVMIFGLKYGAFNYLNF